jgi:hypothetical protein
MHGGRAPGSKPSELSIGRTVPRARIAIARDGAAVGGRLNGRRMIAITARETRRMPPSTAAIIAATLQP